MTDNDIAARPTPGATLKVVGTLMVLAGVVVMLWLASTLWLTGMSTDRAQGELQRQWAADVGNTGRRWGSGTGLSRPARDRRAALARGAYAVMWFSRPDASDPPVQPDRLYVVEGVGPAELRKGPGHYPRTDRPGGDGNFAVSGHRTTYGAPFGRLHELRVGDRVHVVDRRGRQWTYRVLGHRVVDPDATWVLGPDPLDVGGHTMTLTTCHPRWSAAQRLVVFARLSGDV